ncbi:MAG: hypothetical protein Kow0099_13010 [Candidatus Abyssubacteria bacterium]
MAYQTVPAPAIFKGDDARTMRSAPEQDLRSRLGRYFRRLVAWKTGRSTHSTDPVVNISATES